MLKLFKHHHATTGGTCLVKAARFFQALVFPDQCLNCRALLDSAAGALHGEQGCFCRLCLDLGLPRFEPPFCPRCGYLFDTGENHVCDTCLKTPPRIGRVRGPLAYQGLIRDIIPLFKYRARLSLTRFFESLMFEAFENYFGETPIHRILPVPLHGRKMRQRGFNQSLLLVRRFPEMYEQAYGTRPLWQVDISSLRRVRHTRPQTGLDTAVRKKNLKNAFQVTDPAAAIEGAHILLVDDVYTTGATCGEAARVLLAAGAARVDALVLARA